MNSTRHFHSFASFSSSAGRRAGLVALGLCMACSGTDDSNTNGPAAGGSAAVGGATSGTTGGATNNGGPVGGATTGGASASGGSGSSGGDAGVGGAAGGDSSSGGVLQNGVGGDSLASSSGGSQGGDACTMASDLEAEFAECFTVELANATDMARTDSLITVSLAGIQASYGDFNPSAFVVLDGATEVASQAVDQPPKGDVDEIAFMASLGPNETKSYAVRYATSGENLRAYTQRAQAIVSPKTGGSWSGDTYSGGSYTDVDFLDLEGHIEHDFDYMRFEGPGWESDRIGYRTYADGRNAMDIFGKKLPGMILHDIDYVNEDYSSMSDWGMDILKVGEALGIGALGTWEAGAVSRVANLQNITIDILESGPIVALLRITYVDWQTAAGTVNATMDISINAGSRLSKAVVQVDGSLPNICTGIAKHDGTSMSPAPTTTGWNFLANFGLQSLAPDDLGLAVLYHSDDLVEATEDSINHVVVLSPANGPVTYYFLGAWVQEGEGLTNQSDYASYLETTLQQLDAPVGVTIL